MSKRRSKPTVERRNGAKSKALSMSCPPLSNKAGQSAQGRGPVTGPGWRPASCDLVASRQRSRRPNALSKPVGELILGDLARGKAVHGPNCIGLVELKLHAIRHQKQAC